MNVSAGQHQPLRADSQRETEYYNLMLDLLDWVALNTAYSVSKTKKNLPEIVFVKRHDRVIFNGQPLVIEDIFEGLYDAPENLVMLVSPWDSSNSYQVGTLLHELVHVVQSDASNWHWNCKQETEWEAYKLQQAWLIEQSIDSDFNWLAILIRSRCNQSSGHP